MFDHVVFGVSDYAASKAFFLKALEPLGVAVLQEGPLGVELCAPDSRASLCICPTEEKPAHLHLAFAAANRRQVDAFHRAALEAGGKDNGGPGLRPRYHGTTMRLSSSVRTGTTSKWFATNPRPEPLIKRQAAQTCTPPIYSLLALRPVAAGSCKRTWWASPCGPEVRGNRVLHAGGLP